LVEHGETTQSNKKYIPVILTGEAKNRKEAEKVVSRYMKCPYVAFAAHGGNRVYLAYVLPEEQRWWMDEIIKAPTHLLLERIQAVYPEKLFYPPNVALHLPEEKTTVFSCGQHPTVADCSKCLAYQRCLGCPGTVYYKV
jgi:hypothetical protein